MFTQVVEHRANLWLNEPLHRGRNALSVTRDCEARLSSGVLRALVCTGNFGAKLRLFLGAQRWARRLRFGSARRCKLGESKQEGLGLLRRLWIRIKAVKLGRKIGGWVVTGSARRRATQLGMQEGQLALSEVVNLPVDDALDP